jgi:hypothetical protein
VGRTASYDAPFIPMALLLALGSVLWLNVDGSIQLGDGHPAQSHAARPAGETAVS